MQNCNNSYVPIDQNFILKIFKQTLNGLKYLAGKSILHRNIEPDSLLLDESNNVKISGFNISALYYDNNPENKNKESALFTNYTAVGKLYFIAPEIKIGKKYDFKIDMFSLGLTMLCLMSKKYPIEVWRNRETNQTIRKINKDDIEHIADLICSKFPSVLRVNLISLEVRGNCFINKNKVYISPKESFEHSRIAIQKLLRNGIDVGLYNYPLCNVDPGYWFLCKKSISPNKVRYPNECDICNVKEKCGGMFITTMKAAKPEIFPI